MGKRHTVPTPRPKGTLQVKILSGYLLLTLLVGGIVYAVWYEKRVFQQAEQEERAMLGQRKLTNDAFKSLIALLLYSDGACCGTRTTCAPMKRRTAGCRRYWKG